MSIALLNRRGVVNQRQMNQRGHQQRQNEQLRVAATAGLANFFDDELMLIQIVTTDRC